TTLVRCPWEHRRRVDCTRKTVREQLSLHVLCRASELHEHQRQPQPTRRLVLLYVFGLFQESFHILRAVKRTISFSEAPTGATFRNVENPSHSYQEAFSLPYYQADSILNGSWQ